MKKALIIIGMGTIAMLTLGGCSGGGYNSYYVAPQSQEKSLDQVAKDKANSLSTEETAQINKLSTKK
jgi:uncharacterized lipoprotein YmbA